MAVRQSWSVQSDGIVVWDSFGQGPDGGSAVSTLERHYPGWTVVCGWEGVHVWNTTGTLEVEATPEPSGLPGSGSTRRQAIRYRQNAEVVLLGLPTPTAVSLEVRISGTAEGYVRDVSGVKAVAEVFGVEAAAEIMLYQPGVARTAAGMLGFPKHAIVRLEGLVSGFEMGEITPQAGSSATPTVRRSGATRAGQVQPSATSNPTDREIALLALQLIKERRRARRRR